MVKYQLVGISFIIITTVILSGIIINSDEGVVVEYDPKNEHDHDHNHSEEFDNAQNENKRKVEAKDNLKIATSDEVSKGPKGGKLFTKNGFGVEVTIFEKSTPSQFRVYLYENNKPLTPTSARITITVSRFGTPSEVFNFKPNNDYLFSDQTLEKPHSFDMVINADYDGNSFRWGYSQAEAKIKIPDDILKNIGIEIRSAGPTKINPMLNLLGEIGFNEYNIVQIVPRAPGQVVAVKRQRGEHVKKGDVLAIIESPLLVELRSQLLAAKKRLNFEGINLEREKKLWEEKISAKQDYLSAQQAFNDAEIIKDLASAKLLALGIRPETVVQGKDLAIYEIRSPVSGLITGRTLANGQTLKEDAEIFTIADISNVWVQITVYEKDLNFLKIGEETVVRATASDIKGKGTISFITPLIGVTTRTATARVELDNPDGRWLPGMYVSAEVIKENIQAPIAVTVDAIQTLGDETVVFVRNGQYFATRPIRLGSSDGKMVEVLSGLSAGEQYASGNSYVIKSELGKSEASHEH